MFIYQLFVVTVISQLLKLVLSEENKKKIDFEVNLFISCY